MLLLVISYLIESHIHFSFYVFLYYYFSALGQVMREQNQYNCIVTQKNTGLVFHN